MGSGWDTSRFVDTLGGFLKQLECVVCLCVMKDAIQLPCGHSFCLPCVNGVNGICPVDRRNFPRPLTPNFTLRGLVDGLRIHCQFKPKCSHVGTVGYIEKHEADCEYNIVTCDKGCGFRFHASKLASHNCIKTLLAELARSKEKSEEELECHHKQIRELTAGKTKSDISAQSLTAELNELRKKSEAERERYQRQLRDTEASKHVAENCVEALTAELAEYKKQTEQEDDSKQQKIHRLTDELSEFEQLHSLTRSDIERQTIALDKLKEFKRQHDEMERRSNAVIHSCVVCNACGQSPITGPRYKCVQCKNYNLCKRCLREHIGHLMVVFRQPQNGVVNLKKAFKNIKITDS